MAEVLRVGNCSGFYGDRLSAMREMLEGGELDVLAGDYLAELTMLILGRDQLKDPSLGYARTFVRQAEDCLGLALEQGVKIVANAGGLNPAGLAQKLREVASGLGLTVSVAHVQGDNVLDRAADLGLGGSALTANAYLGAFGIAAALTHGADIVVTGRVTDASVVVGPAIARFGWTRTSYDELAGAVVAGHVIECGAQATGGNFAGYVPDDRPLGFPLAEIAADGSCVVTKHNGTGGVVSVDTVTAQLVYEIQSTTYLGPDVSVDLASIRLSQGAPDRVQVSGVRGSAPPDTLKVCVNELGGWRNAAELVLVGLDVEQKAAWARAQLTAALAERPPTSVDWSLARTDHEDADTEEAASCRLRVTVRDPDRDTVGKAFTAPLVELALASYAGFTLTGPPAPATPYGVYRAAYVPRSAVTEQVVLHDGTTLSPADPSVGQQESRSVVAEVTRRPATPTGAGGPTRRVPLGYVVHARSGDKGGDANIGVWAREGRTDRAVWLRCFLTPERVKALLPETADLDVEVFELPNLGAVNVLVHGLLGEGVAASSRFDPQAKALGEWLRSRHVDVPEALL
ncbi:MAG: acyclic terpene utilization AtuA family protein [Nocardioidaceae bacterium]